MSKYIKFDPEELYKNLIMNNNGIDVYGYVHDIDKKVKFLTLEDNYKKKIDQKLSLAYNFLNRNYKQPLLESGNYNNKFDREHKGEWFITPDAVSLILFYESIKNKKKPNKDYSNIIVTQCNDDNKDLKKLLQKDGDNIKLVLYDKYHVHSVPMYVRKHEGKIKCFIASSFGTSTPQNKNVHHYMNAKNYIDFLNKNFDNPIIILNEKAVQKDYYSCATHSINMIKNFAKHGDKLFNDIVSHSKPASSYSKNIKLLSDNHLPTYILKALPYKDIKNNFANRMHEIADDKKNTNLGEYTNKFNDFQDKISSKNILKKYKYFATLENVLRAISDRNDDNQADINKNIYDIIASMRTGKDRNNLCNIYKWCFRLFPDFEVNNKSK